MEQRWVTSILLLLMMIFLRFVVCLSFFVFPEEL
jgi:hypothetical protein